MPVIRSDRSIPSYEEPAYEHDVPYPLLGNEVLMRFDQHTGRTPPHRMTEDTVARLEEHGFHWCPYHKVWSR